METFFSTATVLLPFIGEISQKAGLRGLPFFEFNQYYSHIIT